MSTTTAKNPDAWWAEDGPIPFDNNEPEQFRQPIVVRQQERQQVQQRSEYAELATLAQSVGARDSGRLLGEAKRVGALLGKRAYYDFPVGGGRATGPTIDLMDALAIVWGRLVSRVEIVEETDIRVHLRGRVVDLLAITAVERDYMSAIAPAPGKFARDPEQADRWRTMQLQSASSKAIRGALEHALPAWLVDAALDAARDTVAKRATGGVALPQARGNAIEMLARLGLTAAECAAFVGQPVDLWAVAELDTLRVLVTKLKAGEVSVEGVRAELVRQAATAPSSAPVDRFADLGVKPAAPAPQAQQTPPPPSTPPAASSGTAPSGGSQEPKKDPIKEALLADLRELFRTDAASVTEACRQHGTAPNQIGRLGVEKLSAILKTLRPPVDPNPPAEQAPAEEPPPSEDTQAAIGEWCEALASQGKDDRIAKALADLDIDPEQGPTTEAQAQALLAALKLAGGAS